MKGKNYLSLFITLGILCAGVLPIAGAEDFFEGKTLRFIVGAAPGGGYDTYTRAVARHIGKYIPGNPTPVVQNMTGAGTLIAAHYLYNRADPDGLTVGVWNSGQVLRQALEDPEFLTEAKRTKLIINYVSGEEIENIVAEVLAIPSDVKESLQQLGGKKRTTN